MAAKGGKRKGAGRKSKRVEEGRDVFLNAHLTREKLTKVIDRMLEIATTGDDVKAAVSAGSLLLAYAFGKPTEKHEVGGEGGGPITLKVIYEHPRTNDPAS